MFYIFIENRIESFSYLFIIIYVMLCYVIFTIIYFVIFKETKKLSYIIIIIISIY